MNQRTVSDRWFPNVKKIKNKKIKAVAFFLQTKSYPEANSVQGWYDGGSGGKGSVEVQEAAPSAAPGPLDSPQVENPQIFWSLRLILQCSEVKRSIARGGI